MVEQAVERCDAAEEVTLKQRHERTPVPRRKRQEEAGASSMMITHSIVKGISTISLAIEVVRFGQLGQQPARILGQRKSGEWLLHRRC